MQLEQRFTIAAPIDVVWDAFQNVEVLVSSLPGAELISAVSNDDLKLKFSIKLGPIAAQFEGTGAVVHDHAAKSGTFSGQAADRKSNSRVKGAANFRLMDDMASGDATTVTVDVDYALTGPMAQFSRGAIVRELAQQLTHDFAANLQSRMVPSVERAEAPNAPSTPEAASSPTQTQALDAHSLIARAFMRWLKRLFGLAS